MNTITTSQVQLIPGNSSFLVLRFLSLLFSVASFYSIDKYSTVQPVTVTAHNVLASSLWYFEWEMFPIGSCTAHLVPSWWHCWGCGAAREVWHRLGLTCWACPASFCCLYRLNVICQLPASLTMPSLPLWTCSLSGTVCQNKPFLKLFLVMVFHPLFLP